MSLMGKYGGIPVALGICLAACTVQEAAKLTAVSVSEELALSSAWCGSLHESPAVHGVVSVRARDHGAEYFTTTHADYSSRAAQLYFVDNFKTYQTTWLLSYLRPHSLVKGCLYKEDAVRRQCWYCLAESTKLEDYCNSCGVLCAKGLV